MRSEMSIVTWCDNRHGQMRFAITAIDEYGRRAALRPSGQQMAEMTKMLVDYMRQQVKPRTTKAIDNSEGESK